MAPDGHERRRADLVADLVARGVLTDAAWRPALEKVPRHLFLPDVVWGDDIAAGDGRLVAVPRTHPDWSRWAYDDVSVITQVDDGSPAFDDGRGDRATSSASQPSLVVEMLQELGVGDGTRVLEVGTGTGYNAALLCERLGSDNVTSIEVDAHVAAQAAASLHATGYKPTLIVGDGAQPVGGVFDRVLATVAARTIPPAWVSQTRPGGVIVIPWATGWATTVLLRLDVSGDGTATGRIVGDAPFMWLRDQRVPGGGWREHVREGAPDAVAYRTVLDPRIVSDRHSGLELVIGALVPGLSSARFDAGDGSGEATIYVFDRAGSWALAEYSPDESDWEAHRGGPRDLWSEIGSASEAWEAAGRPGRERLGVTVTARGDHTLWVDAPDNPVPVNPRS